MENTVPRREDAGPSCYVQAIRPEELPQMAAVLRQIELYREYAVLFQLDVILDANVVLRELMWLSRKRKNPRARPEVLELLECRTVRGHAPTFLMEEIEAKLPKLAQQYRISEETMRAHWEHYRARIIFVDAGRPSRARKVRDHKDTPYVRLQKKLEFPIASHDSDIAAMGGKVLRMQVFGSLKVYSRNRAVELHLKVVGMRAAVAVFALASLFMRGAKGVAIGVSQLPRPVLWLAVGLLAFALVHPDSRKRIFEIVTRLLGGAAVALEFAFSTMQPLLSDHYGAKERAAAGLADARGLLGSGSTSST